jgi:beta-xylosidase
LNFVQTCDNLRNSEWWSIWLSPPMDPHEEVFVNRRGFLVGAASASAGFALPGTALLAAAEKHHLRTFRYKNPILTATVRDCQIIRENGIYYMTGTFPPFWGEKPSPGVRISRSSDLLNWSTPEVVLTPQSWFQQLFWAPEIFPHQGRYYLTFNCPAEGNQPIGNGKNIHQSVGLAVADTVTGPYHVLTAAKPLVEGNDATLFLDSNGRTYLYHTTKVGEIEGIGCTRVDLRRGKAIGSTILCVTKGDRPGWDGGHGVGIEGPSVFKRGSLYYLLYSSWGRGYEVGYATARSPLGPWHKSNDNPIFGAQDPEWTKNYSGVYDQPEDVPFGQVGHGSPFFGPDGQIWFSCHGIMQKGRGYDLDPHLIIAPMTFRADGRIGMKLTWTEQVVEKPARADPYWRPNGSPASARQN